MSSINFAFIVMLLLVFICLVSTSTFTVSSRQDRQEWHPKSVVMIHRHGDRNPISVGHKDPHRDPSEWPDGLAQLTKKGKLRMFYLGLHTRERYKDFLSDKIDEIYVRAADLDRCIASAELVLSGLYQPYNSRSRWNPKLNWQPVPVHSVPKEYDALLETKQACPKIGAQFKIMQQTTQVKKLYERIQSLLDFIECDLGLKAESFEQISWLFGDLKAEDEVGKSLPDWYNATNRKLLEEASIEVVSLYTSSDLLKKLQSGPLLGEIYKRLSNSNFTDGEDVHHDKIFFQYSTHDTEMINLMNTLNVWDHKLPPYGLTLFFELHERQSDKTNHVRLFKLNDLAHSVIELTLDCGQLDGELCSLEQFKGLVESLQVEDWSATCHG